MGPRDRVDSVGPEQILTRMVLLAFEQPQFELYGIHLGVGFISHQNLQRNITKFPQFFLVLRIIAQGQPKNSET